MITLGDPSDKFMIRLPYSWDIQENYSDTLYGIIASNRYEAGNDPEKFILVSVTGYQTTDSLFAYFKKELKTLKKDKSMKVIEVGQMELNEENTYWVKFESDQSGYKIMNIVQYVKSEEKNEIYLIQSSVYKSDDYQTQLCRLKRLTNSFELVYDN
jgi:catalase